MEKKLFVLARASLRTTFCRSRDASTLRRATWSGEVRQDGAVLSIARVRLRSMYAGYSCMKYVEPADIFTEYAYFSSYADSWVQHAKLYRYR